ncbi:phage tail protein [Hymenobacter sp. CRA2]|uniref:phage tail protein n=1 Tax=Hymenobacter sp. CRA2 TaxID=1955620 RepID=UPI00098F32DE|nr:tail fiber protein [Hymenobacter sp. CRA2]OON68235.1 phage tail protein [Hymenobacter sp. CRA2]
MDEAYIGSIVLFAGTFAPRGWAFCNGQQLSIAQNTALFSILGTTYGGNGQTTFGLPDLRGRVPVHSGMSQGPGLSPYQLGQMSGTENVTLTTAELPAHNHQLNVSKSAGSVSNPAGGFLAITNGTDVNGESVTVNAYAPNGDATAAPASIGLAGGNKPVNLVQPVLGLNYIICLQGLFPSRD